jgi:CheY-like chemotaxis protein
LTELVRPIEILLVEDNPGDLRLTKEALADAKVRNHLNSVIDGVEALKFLRQEPPYNNAQRPDLILLDLNLPRKDGREVLLEIKNDPKLKRIPVVVKSYNLHANCYVTKPIDLQQFVTVVRAIEDFWMTIVKLPAA